jgi:hypothetical protein
VQPFGGFVATYLGDDHLFRPPAGTRGRRRARFLRLFCEFHLSDLLCRHSELVLRHNPLLLGALSADSWCPAENYNDRGPNRASIIRLASATISSVRLFSRLDGLSANARVDPGAKIAALQPFPTGLTSIRYPLYSIAVIACAISIRHAALTQTALATQVSLERGRRPKYKDAAAYIAFASYIRTRPVRNSRTIVMWAARVSLCIVPG